MFRRVPLKPTLRQSLWVVEGLCCFLTRRLAEAARDLTHGIGCIFDHFGKRQGFSPCSEARYLRRAAASIFSVGSVTTDPFTRFFRLIFSCAFHELRRSSVSGRWWSFPVNRTEFDSCGRPGIGPPTSKSSFYCRIASNVQFTPHQGSTGRMIPVVKIDKTKRNPATPILGCTNR
jgi:hypothetical protein